LPDVPAINQRTRSRDIAAQLDRRFSRPASFQDGAEEMNSWEKAKALSTIISALAVPVVLAVIGYYFNAALKEREVQGKFVELAVAILREQTQESTRPLRSWATRVIDRYSGVPLTEEAKALLLQKQSFPGWERVEVYGSMLPDEVPAMLAYLGHYVPLGSDYKGARLEAAIREYQKKQGLPATGLADRATKEALRKDVEQRRQRGGK
jgi:hypothetical protein